MNLTAIYKVYKKDPNDEISKKLCARIKKLARIVLYQFKIKNMSRLYEDLIQTAYLCFFELLDTYDPDKGSLDGYFMTAFKRDVIDSLNEMYFYEYEEVADDSLNPEGFLLANELEKHMKEFLTEQEFAIFDVYMRNENYTIEEIAEEENMPLYQAKAIVANIRRKVLEWMTEEEIYVDYGPNQVDEEGLENEDGDCRNGV